MRVLSICCFLLAGSLAVGVEPDSVSSSLLFHASFDDSVNADFADGDARLFTAESIQRNKTRAGLHATPVKLEEHGGRFGGCLHFQAPTKQLVYFRGGKNVPAAADDFQGTVSVWMRLNPDEDLEPGFVDPLQITDKKWNDASFFIDFTKENPRQFRLGVFSNYRFWNPEDRPWDDIAIAERPMVTVTKLPFGGDRWTHVCFTWQGFNTGRPEGNAKLYLDGKPQGSVNGKQRFTWAADNVAIMLGIQYVGWLDDLAIFDRALSPREVQSLSKLESGVHGLHEQD